MEQVYQLISKQTMLRQLFLALMTLALLPTLLKADPWDCMTMEEAQKLVSFLKKNPYIVDYCDCCDQVSREYDQKKLPAFLLRVEGMEIKTCSWDPNSYSVEISSTKILVSGYVENGIFGIASVDEEELRNYLRAWPVAVNYSFSLENKKAVRLYPKIDMQGDDPACAPLQAFPDPKEMILTKGLKLKIAKASATQIEERDWDSKEWKAYIKFYKSRMK